MIFWNAAAGHGILGGYAWGQASTVDTGQASTVDPPGSPVISTMFWNAVVANPAPVRNRGSGFETEPDEVM